MASWAGRSEGPRAADQQHSVNMQKNPENLQTLERVLQHQGVSNEGCQARTDDTGLGQWLGCRQHL